MSNSVARNVHRAISFVSVVGSMRATIAATLTTSVPIIVDSAKMNSSCAVHGTSFCPYLVRLLKKA